MNKEIYNRILSFLVFIVSCLATANGQEDTSITTKLKGIYGMAYYLNTNGGWYPIESNGKKEHAIFVVTRLFLLNMKR